MGQHYLKPLFAPESVAVFGASERVDSVGQIVFSNMLKSGFQGALYPINPKHEEIQGHKAYASLFQISDTVELAVIATPPQTVPDIIEDCGKHGVKAAVIITAGFAEAGATGLVLEHAVLRHPPAGPQLPRHHAPRHRPECDVQQGQRKRGQAGFFVAIRRAVHRHSGLGTDQ